MGPLSSLDFYLAGPELESPGRYRPGGYHPVHLGDLYCQRYRVIHKPGFCGYSTVWLARDLQSTAQTRVIVVVNFSLLSHDHSSQQAPATNNPSTI